MRRIAITLTALFALSLFAAAPALAQNFGNCGRQNYGYRGGNYYPGSVGYFAVPGRVVVGYRSVGGVGGYSQYGNLLYGGNGLNNYGGYGTYGSGYGGYGSYGPGYGGYGSYGPGYGGYGSYGVGNSGFGFYFGN